MEGGKQFSLKWQGRREGRFHCLVGLKEKRGRTEQDLYRPEDIMGLRDEFTHRCEVELSVTGLSCWGYT